MSVCFCASFCLSSVCNLELRFARPLLSVPNSRYEHKSFLCGSVGIIVAFAVTVLRFAILCVGSEFVSVCRYGVLIKFCSFVIGVCFLLRCCVYVRPCGVEMCSGL